MPSKRLLYSQILRRGDMLLYPTEGQWRSTGVSKEAEGEGETEGKSLYCGLHGKE